MVDCVTIWRLRACSIQLYEEKRLAADVTKDGQVKAADALNILKIAVKFSTAPEMEWLSLPKSVGSESMSRTYVVWPNSPIPVTLDMDQDVNLIGIVEDDVDGSWSAVG